MPAYLHVCLLQRMRYLQRPREALRTLLVSLQRSITDCSAVRKCVALWRSTGLHVASSSLPSDAST